MAAHQLFFHIVWTTLERRPMIDGATRDFLGDFLRRTAVRERAEVVAIAILQTHVHVLVRSGPRVDLSRMVQVMKRWEQLRRKSPARKSTRAAVGTGVLGDDGKPQESAEGRRVPRDAGTAPPR